jgi:hypothetical protein
MATNLERKSPIGHRHIEKVVIATICIPIDRKVVEVFRMKMRTVLILIHNAHRTVLLAVPSLIITAHSKKLLRSKPSGQTLALTLDFGNTWQLDLAGKRLLFNRKRLLASSPCSRGLLTPF